MFHVRGYLMYRPDRALPADQRPLLPAHPVFKQLATRYDTKNDKMLEGCVAIQDIEPQQIERKE